jgi:hypothetical protein
MPVRSYAMMHAAMFDAVNSIDGTYTPYSKAMCQAAGAGQRNSAPGSNIAIGSATFNFGTQ